MKSIQKYSRTMLPLFVKISMTTTPCGGPTTCDEICWLKNSIFLQLPCEKIWLAMKTWKTPAFKPKNVKLYLNMPRTSVKSLIFVLAGIDDSKSSKELHQKKFVFGITVPAIRQIILDPLNRRWKRHKISDSIFQNISWIRYFWSPWRTRKVREHKVEISWLICHSYFTWNQFWSNWSPQNCHFDHFCRSEFWTFGHFWHFQVWKFLKNQNFKPSKWLKWQFLTFWNQPKLISSENKSGRKILKFLWLGQLHSVEISGFFCHSDFTWNLFWSFWSPKNCHFDHLSMSEFWIFGNFLTFSSARDFQKIKIWSLQNG